MKTNNVIIKQSCIRVWASCLSPYVFNYISCHFQSWLAASVNKHDASSGQSVLKRCNIFPALPCRHLITGRSKCVDVGVCLSASAFHTDQHLSGTRGSSATNTYSRPSKQVHQSCSVSTYSLVQEKNQSKWRQLQQLWACGKATYLVQQVLREKLTLALLFSCMSQSLNRDKHAHLLTHTCDFIAYEKLGAFAVRTRQDRG